MRTIFGVDWHICQLALEEVLCVLVARVKRDRLLVHCYYACFDNLRNMHMRDSVLQRRACHKMITHPYFKQMLQAQFSSHLAFEIGYANIRSPELLQWVWELVPPSGRLQPNLHGAAVCLQAAVLRRCATVGIDAIAGVAAACLWSGLRDGCCSA